MPDLPPIDYDQPIALFPLPGCVLFPHATLPLHIFEPRYRRMTRDALDADGLIAMALFQGNHWKDDYHGKPALRPAVGVGRIVQHQRLPDGRYNLLLIGVARARILDELPHDPYRLARLEPIESLDSLEIDLADQRQQLEQLLRDPTLAQLAAVVRLLAVLDRQPSTIDLTDLTAAALLDQLEPRYSLLADPDPAVRVARIIDHLRHLRRTLRIADRFQTEPDPNGSTRN